MLNTSWKYYRIVTLNKLLHTNYIQLNTKRRFRLPLKPTCLCSLNYNHRSIRVHSTHSDQHRQKAIIETTTPKIVIEKIDLDKELPVEKSFERKELWKDRILPYVQLARWDKPIGVYLLYWPCSWSIALGSISGTVPFATSVEMAGLFLVGAGLMRGAGCTINDLWDRDIDAQVERTRSRPLVSGAISESQAVIFLAAQLSLALGVLLQLNCYSVVLGASSMLLVVTYPLAKRFTNYPQIFLGATFNWGALLGYSAIQGTIDPAVCLPLYFGALAWTVLYDTIYAHQDKLDDARIGMKSTALTFGARSKPALSGVLALGAASLAGAGLLAGLGGAYHAALGAFVLHAGRQIYTLQPDNPQDCAKKFKSNSSVGFIILLGILGGGYRPKQGNSTGNRHVLRFYTKHLQDVLNAVSLDVTPPTYLANRRTESACDFLLSFLVWDLTKEIFGITY